jgi:hypothetical protein
MPWFKVSVAIWTELDGGEIDALAAVMDAMPAVGEHEPLRLVDGGPAEELDEAQVQELLEFIAMLTAAKADAASGIVVTDPAHPGVAFSPAAAAELISLEAEDITGQD